VLIALAVWQVDAARLAVAPAALSLVALAVLAAPACIVLELAVQQLVRTGSLRGLAQIWGVHGFWQARPPVSAYAFVIAIAVGEEFVYRHLAHGILLEFGVGTGLAVAITALFYGLNHLYFGGVTVLSKTLVGVVLAGLYVAGGGSLLLPAIAHALQSVLILSLSARRG
jgi:membrane protease YdiL (CAAX protease family)